MIIRFLQGDPRAGLVARMDSSRGRDLVEMGAAEELSESEATAVSQPEAKQEPDDAPKAKKTPKGKTAEP